MRKILYLQKSQRCIACSATTRVYSIRGKYGSTPHPMCKQYEKYFGTSAVFYCVALGRDPFAHPAPLRP